MTLQDFLAKKLFTIDGFTLTVFGLALLVLVIWLLFLRK